MTERELGKSGLWVSAIGLGCMGMSDFYNPKQQNDDESVRVIHSYLDAGGNLLDTADQYGVGRNEALVGKAVKGRREYNSREMRGVSVLLLPQKGSHRWTCN